MADPTTRLQCSYCNAIFVRQEHLSRHLLRHSESRPFQCPTCGRSFSRRDTLKRHISTHGPEALQSYASWASTASHRTRACRQCARVKKRCVGNTPCARCVKKALPCEPDGKIAKEPVSSLQSGQYDPESLTESAGAEQSPTALQTQDAPASPLVSARSPVPIINHTEGMSGSDVPDFSIPDADMVNLMNAPQLDCFNQPFLGTPGFPFFWTSGPQLSTVPGFDGFDTFQAIPGVVDDNLAPGRAIAQRQDCNEATGLQSRSNDNEDEDDMDTLAAEDFGHPCKISADSFQRVRDFLQERLKFCQDKSRPYYPSLPAMNAFIQLYFENFSPQMPFIHAPTFEPDNATELLLIAVANIGCQYSRSRHRHAYRSLFMSVLENSIQKQLPHNPANNNLELMQCVLLYHVCLMCGGLISDVVKLQFERNNLATLFCHSRRPMYRVNQQCSTATMAPDIKSLWRSWIDAETERRVLYSTWVLECCNKIFYEGNPLLSIFELNMALPSTEDLWDAPDAQAWHSLYLRDRKGTPSLSTLFLGARPSDETLKGLEGFSRTIAMMTFNIEEQKILESSRCWIFPAAYSPTGQSYRTRLLRDRDSDLSLFGFDAPFHPPGSVRDASGKRYFHLICLLRDVQLRHLYAFAGWKATDVEVNASREALSVWMRSNREGGRECLLHAGALFGDVRNQIYKVSFDPFFLLISILYLWAFQKLSPDVSSGVGLKPLRIDCDVDEAVAKQWIHGKSEYVVHVTGVGRLTGRDSAIRLLKELRRVLLSQTSWTTLHMGVAKAIEQMMKGEKPLEPDI